MVEKKRKGQGGGNDTSARVFVRWQTEGQKKVEHMHHYNSNLMRGDADV